MRFKTFEEWRQENPDPESEPCPTCDGDGRHSCECGHEHRCEDCNGSGYLSESPEMIERAQRKRYEAEKAATVVKLAAWGIQV